MKIKLLVEVDVGDGICGETPEEVAYFHDEILKYKDENDALYLHSNYIGDEMGRVTVLEIY